MSSTLLRVYPSELKIPYEVKKQRSCCMQLTNRTDLFVAFKVKTTNPRKYSVRHSCGVVLPRGSCNVTVIMQAPLEMLSDHHCKDKFLVQSVVLQDGATMKAFGPQLFTKAPGRVIEEFKLRVVYIAANPPSPVPEEEEEEDSSPRSEVVCGVKTSSTFDAEHRCVGVSAAERSCPEGTSVLLEMVKEREYAVDKHQKLQQDMPKNDVFYPPTMVATSHTICMPSELLHEQPPDASLELLGETRSSQQGFSLMFVVFVFMSSMFIGHLMNEIMV